MCKYHTRQHYDFAFKCYHLASGSLKKSRMSSYKPQYAAWLCTENVFLLLYYPYWVHFHMLLKHSMSIINHASLLNVCNSDFLIKYFIYFIHGNHIQTAAEKKYQDSKRNSALVQANHDRLCADHKVQKCKASSTLFARKQARQNLKK